MKEVLNISSSSQQPKCCQVDHVSSCQIFKLDPAVLGDSKLNLSPLYEGNFDLVENIDNNSDAYYYKKISGYYDLIFCFEKGSVERYQAMN